MNPPPSVVVVSGLCELFHDNELLRRSLRGIYQALPPGGWLIYTGQPWHPKVEMIARTLTNRDGRPWIMRRRPQGEMDALVREGVVHPHWHFHAPCVAAPFHGCRQWVSHGMVDQGADSGLAEEIGTAHACAPQDGPAGWRSGGCFWNHGAHGGRMVMVRLANGRVCHSLDCLFSTRPPYAGKGKWNTFARCRIDW